MQDGELDDTLNAHHGDGLATADESYLSAVGMPDDSGYVANGHGPSASFQLDPQGQALQLSLGAVSADFQTELQQWLIDRGITIGEFNLPP